MAGPILVTGAAGFVGGHLLDLLVAQRHSVVGWYRPGSDTSRLRQGVSWAPVELLDGAAVARAVADTRPSAVYHLAGAAHVGQSWQFTLETYQNNVLASHHLLSALERVSPGARVLVSCSGTIYRPQDRPIREEDPVGPASPYATSKLAQEMLAVHAWRDHRVPTLIARSFNHTGSGQDPSYVAAGIARQIARIEEELQDPLLRVGNLEPKRDLSDVRDVVRAYVAMMERATPGRPYNVCSGRGLSIQSLVDTFIARARVPINVVQDQALFRPNDAPLLVGSHERLTEDTGWQPHVSIEATIDDLLAYWRHRVQSHGASA